MVDVLDLIEVLWGGGEDNLYWLEVGLVPFVLEQLQLSDELVPRNIGDDLGIVMWGWIYFRLSSTFALVSFIVLFPLLLFPSGNIHSHPIISSSHSRPSSSNRGRFVSICRSVSQQGQSRTWSLGNAHLNTLPTTAASQQVILRTNHALQQLIGDRNPGGRVHISKQHYIMLAFI